MSKNMHKLKITFDSNVLPSVIQPEAVHGRSIFDMHDLQIVNEAIRTGCVEGFVAQTFFTKEAVPKINREDVYRIAFKRYKNPPFPSTAPCINMANTKALSAKKQFDSKNVFTRRNLLPLLRKYHIRILHTYLLGDILPQLKNGESIEDVFSIDDFYCKDGNEDEVMIRNDECFHFIIDDLKASVICVDVIDKVDNRHDKHTNLSSKFNKIVAEEADVQAIATHYAHQIDVFCTEDKGNSAGGNSVMKAENKTALFRKFGIRFCTLAELARMIEL